MADEESIGSAQSWPYGPTGAVLARARSCLMSVMAKLFFVAAAAVLGSLGCSGGNAIDVAFRDGKIAAPATVGAGHLVFRVHNEEAVEQRFAVVDLRTVEGSGNAVRPWEPGALPVENGLVRDYTYMDEPGLGIRTSGEGYSQAYAGSTDRRPRPETIGVVVAAGAAKDIEISYMKTDAGSTFVLFSDLPGRYESGQWSAVTVK